MRFRAVLILLAAAISCAAPAFAQGGAASPWVRNDHAGVRLIAATATAGSGDVIRAGLHFTLRPGWKTYWRNPGDAGFAPRADWAASDNVAEVTLRWPAPERFELFGLETFGYADEVVLPLDIRVARAGDPVALRGALEYLVCERVCIPYTAELRLDLPAGPVRPSAEAHLINRFEARVPTVGSGLGVANASLRLDPPALAVQVTSTLPLEHPDAIVEGPDGWAFTRPTVALAADRLSATLLLPVHGDVSRARDLVGRTLAITVTDGPRAGEGRANVLAFDGAAPSGTMLGVIALAVVGGLILNVMPCVLPVLSLKLLGVVAQAGVARGRVRLSFLASAAGILAAFLALAGVLIALRAGGHGIGWGIQFQQPLFLASMAVLVTLFAANLWGWFAINLPGRVADLADRGAGAAERRGSLMGAFASGAFATVLATPCSAPFLGTAVGFALARGPVEILTIFSALGVGLASPYLVLAVFPDLVRALPRPGAWMIVLRRVLGFALALTAVWLIFVLRTQIGDVPASVIAAVLAALLAVLFVLRHAGAPVRGAVCAGAACVALLLAAMPGALPSGYGADGGSRWQAFDRDRIATLVRAGQVVFVDVTASWCVTCQVNKAAVVNRGPVADRLAGTGIVAMRADWTRPDARISDYLASFGRYGIPFNAVYGPNAPEGIALPEILTDQAVLAAFDRAAGGRTAAR